MRTRLPVVTGVLVAATISLTLAATCGAGSTPTASSTAAVTGRVTAGPTCPVERADHPCPPAPVSATVQAKTKNGRVVASAHTDADGRYRLRLRAGAYVLVAVTANTFPRCAPTEVTARANQTTRAAISCDTGIR